MRFRTFLLSLGGAAGIGFLSARAAYKRNSYASFPLSTVIYLGITGYTAWQFLGDSRRRVILTQVKSAVDATRADLDRLREPEWLRELRNHYGESISE